MWPSQVCPQAQHRPHGGVESWSRFGQYAFNQYRKTYGRPPYTRRINGNGPVKVYLDPIEYIFLSRTYEQWRRRQQGKEHA